MNINPINNINFSATFNVYNRANIVNIDVKALSEQEKIFREKTKNIPGELILASYGGLYENPRLSYSTANHYDFLDVKLGHFYDKESFLGDLEKILNIFLKRKPIIVKMLKVKEPDKVHEIAQEIIPLAAEMPDLKNINIVNESFNSRIIQLERFLQD